MVREPESSADCLVAAIGSWFRSRLSLINNRAFPAPIKEEIRLATYDALDMSTFCLATDPKEGK